ncbi:hypothetical protein D4R30_00055 [archaeon]|nr:MAG: hypothetical protein D4R30_00055 [archaeon]
MPKKNKAGKDLKTLEEHVIAKAKDDADHNVDAATPVLNGMACPTCSEELQDDGKLLVLMTVPPQRPVTCPACKWKGLRRA